MADGINYCRAYLVRDLAAYPGWRESDGAGMNPDDVCYVHEDFRVTADASPDGRRLLDAASAEWRDFCINQLGFAVPPDIRMRSAGSDNGVQRR